MTDRETRLRERIDELTDQRDQALLDLHIIRADRDSLRGMVTALRRQMFVSGTSRRNIEIHRLRDRVEQLRRELDGERFMRRQAQAGLREGGTHLLEEGTGDRVAVAAPAAAFAQSDSCSTSAAAGMDFGGSPPAAAEGV